MKLEWLLFRPGHNTKTVVQQDSVKALHDNRNVLKLLLWWWWLLLLSPPPSRRARITKTKPEGASEHHFGLIKCDLTSNSRTRRSAELTVYRFVIISWRFLYSCELFVLFNGVLSTKTNNAKVWYMIKAVILMLFIWKIHAWKRKNISHHTSLLDMLIMQNFSSLLRCRRY